MRKGTTPNTISGGVRGGTPPPEKICLGGLGAQRLVILDIDRSRSIIYGKIVNLTQLNECGCTIQDLKSICLNTKVMKLRLFKTRHISSLHLPIFWVEVPVPFHLLICVVNQTPILTKLFSFTYYH